MLRGAFRIPTPRAPERPTDTPGPGRLTYGDAVITPRYALPAAVSLLLMTSGIAAPAQADTPTVGSRVPAGLESFYGQSLDWQPCQQATVCAWLTVPLDYADPAGATIRIRVSKVPASGSQGATAGSLVVNPGGPGASGLDFARYVATSVSPAVGAAYDVIGFDPRGVGQSAPITCMTARQTTRWLRTDPSPDTTAEQRTIMSRARQLAQGCLRMSPQIARHVGTDQAVQDLDVLRSALASDRLNFLGFSYGTYLGTLYAEQFPDAVGRFVLDGAVDPSLDVMEVSEGQSRGFQRAMQRFAADCAPRSTCPWRGSAKRVLTGVNGLLNRIERTPLPTHTGPPLVQAEALSAMFYAMYSPILWGPLRLALREADRGDGLALQRLSDYANDKTGPNRYGSNMASAFPAIACWDGPPAPDAAGLASAASRWSKGAAVPNMASAMSWGNAPCSVWYGHTSRQPAPAQTSTTAPILVVGTTFDPATPYWWATALHKQLPTSGLLTYRGDGHTAFGSGSTCVDDNVTGFLLTGTLPATGTVCRA